MKTRLIVLIDFSPYSEMLLKVAASWGRIMDAQLILVHQLSVAIPAMADMESRTQVLESEKAEAREKLRELVNNTIETPLTIIYEVSEINLTLTLDELLKQNYRNLVLLGLKGAGFLKKFFIGSTATKIIEEVNSLTVAVPDHLSSLVPEKLVIALNHKFPLNEKAFSAFLKPFRTEIKQLEFITVTTSGDNEEENRNYVSRISARYGTEFRTSHKIFKADNVFSEIKNYVRSAYHDSFLVVQKGPRNFSDKLFRNYLINDLLDDGSLPLIVIPI